ncbi:acetate/propionate family kinase [Terrimonas alba]|uniref:acetate/propionate family kinase n=1 Tax=Terrimonas alba TaxID=3349636 RepID=UPI0035F2B0BD
MTEERIQTFAAINSGSSTLKFGLFPIEEPMQQVVKGKISGIGSRKCSFSVITSTKHSVLCDPVDVETAEKAAILVIKWLKEHNKQYEIMGIGHRIVHGGLKFHEPLCIDDKLMNDLEDLASFAPLHMPEAISIIHVFRQSFPGVAEVACFDTAFHHQMPFEARHYAIPRSLWAEGVIRYGFHGISCEYICRYFQQAGLDLAGKKIIVAHLGSGSSITAIKDGVSMDTSMGFTPAGGMMMNSRAGDIDPGIASYLVKKGMNADEIDELFNKQSGLNAIAGSNHSIAQLQEEGADPKAAQAIKMYCYQARKQIGALAAAMGGVDLLVFTGGIGENDPPVRKQICTGLEFLGIELNEASNDRNDEIISELRSNAIVYVIPANEELIIAGHVKEVSQK